MIPAFSTKAKGKLLLSAEYAVLDGALALAVPVRYGQTLEATATEQSKILHWKACSETGQVWFEAQFGLPNFDLIATADEGTATTLRSILEAIRRQNNAFPFVSEGGLYIKTQTDFPRQWGLGTSSTLIAALAKWANVDPYVVLRETLGGSGYDLACAYAKGPVLYQIIDNQPTVQEVGFNPPFADQLYFVFLGKKQDSRAGIRHYKALTEGREKLVERLSTITKAILQTNTLTEMEQLMGEHENLLSHTLQLLRVKDQFFKDYPGQVKSLGAWGGDFVLATSPLSSAETRAYFQEKGFEVVIGWEEMLGSDE